MEWALNQLMSTCLYINSLLTTIPVNYYTSCMACLQCSTWGLSLFRTFGDRSPEKYSVPSEVPFCYRNQSTQLWRHFLKERWDWWLHCSIYLLLKHTNRSSVCLPPCPTASPTRHQGVPLLLIWKSSSSQHLWLAYFPKSAYWWFSMLSLCYGSHLTGIPISFLVHFLSHHFLTLSMGSQLWSLRIGSSSLA